MVVPLTGTTNHFHANFFVEQKGERGYLCCISDVAMRFGLLPKPLALLKNDWIHNCLHPNPILIYRQISWVTRR